MPVIIFAGLIDKKTKTQYISALTKIIPNSAYFNIDTLVNVFSSPASSFFTEKYSHDQRMVYPSHAAILGIARDNNHAKKTIILDGNFNYSLLANYLQKDFLDLQAAGIFVLQFSEFANSLLPDDLKTLSQYSKVLMINPVQSMNENISIILSQMQKTSEHQQLADTQGVLVLTAGLAGVGKTTHFKQVYFRVAHSVCLDKDSAAIPFLESVNQGMPSDYYNVHVKNQSYEVVFKLATENLQFNKTPILEGCFGDKLSGNLVTECLSTNKYITTLIYFHCDGPTQLARILKRGAQRDTEKLKDMASDRKTNIQKHLKDFSQIVTLEDVLFIDTQKEEDLNSNVGKVIQHITSSNLQSLKMQKRNIPYDDASCAVLIEEAQGDLTTFRMLLDRTIKKDNCLQISKSRNNLWAEQANAVKMQGFGLKLASGNVLWSLDGEEVENKQVQLKWK